MSVDHKVTQSQSTEFSHNAPTLSSKISSAEMSKPESNQIEDAAGCHTTSCDNLEKGHISSKDTQLDVSNSANEIQDFCDAPPGEASQEGQIRSPKAYLNWSYAAHKNKKWLEYNPTSAVR